MSDQCEFLGTCGFFLNYKGNTEVVRQGWVSLFCEDEQKSKQCERKKVRQATGQPPADNMAPTGSMLVVVEESGGRLDAKLGARI
jgi:hypothetical protein